MKRTGLALIELLVAIAVGVTVMGGAFLALRQAARSLSTEQKVTLSQDQGARVLQGLSGELKGRPAAFLLPGASEEGATLVTLVGNGWPVLSNGYGSQKIRITGGVPDLQVGAPAALVSPSGEVFYINALASIAPIDATAGVYELDFGNNCGNPLSFVQGMRIYKTDTLTIIKTPGGLEIRGASLENQQVVALRDFTLRYVYSSPEKETFSQTHQGASLPDGSRLTALAFQAIGTTEASRAYTARISLKSGTVEVLNVVTCGGTSTPATGRGVVTVVINPAPPGGGDVTLFASGYTRTTRLSYTFRDVPVGNVTVQAQDVWTDNLTAWAPNPRNQSGTLYTFAPLTFTISYSIVPGTLILFASGFPADGRVTVSAGPYSATLGGDASQTISAMPGVYETSASAEVSVSRSQGSVSWTEIYTLESISPTPEVSVRSYSNASVTAAYTGPLPGTLCYDGSCREAPPGRYVAPAGEVINAWSNSYTRSCPAGEAGSVTVTEVWQRVKYWTPAVGGLSSRETLRFRSTMRDEMVDRAESWDCTPIEPPTTQASWVQTSQGISSRFSDLGPTHHQDTSSRFSDPTHRPPPDPTRTSNGRPPDPTRTSYYDPTNVSYYDPTNVSYYDPTNVSYYDPTNVSYYDPRNPSGPTPTDPPGPPTNPPGPGPTDPSTSSSENNNDGGGLGGSGVQWLDPSGISNYNLSLFGLRRDHFRSEHPKPKYLLPLSWTLDTQL